MWPKFIPLRAQHEERVLRAAWAYARMKKFGITIENDMVCHLPLVDSTNTAEHLGRDLLHAAEDLLSAMSIDEADGKLAP